VSRCSEPLGRAALLRVLNEGRTVEVLVGSAGNSKSFGGDGSFSAGGSAEHGDDAEGSNSLASDIGESGLSIRFEVLCSVFEGALRYCDEQRDVKHAKQFMIMSDSYKGVDFRGMGIVNTTNNTNNPSIPNALTPLSARRLRTQSSIGTGVVYVQAAVRTHVIWGRRWFWEEVKPNEMFDRRIETLEIRYVLHALCFRVTRV